MTRTPAIAIRNEIRQLTNLHIEVFGRSTALTPFDLEECHRRAERIKMLGQELDRIGLQTIPPENLSRAS